MISKKCSPDQLMHSVPPQYFVNPHHPAHPSHPLLFLPVLRQYLLSAIQRKIHSLVSPLPPLHFVYFRHLSSLAPSQSHNFLVSMNCSLHSHLPSVQWYCNLHCFQREYPLLSLPLFHQSPPVLDPLPLPSHPPLFLLTHFHPLQYHHSYSHCYHHHHHHYLHSHWYHWYL